MTATAVTSVCTEPPALLVCVNKVTTFYGRLFASGNFCINMLGLPHVRIAQAFSGGLKGVERFERGYWAVARALPYLIHAQANLFCKTESVTHFGTHGIFVGRVEEVRFADTSAPLVYHNGHYVTISRLPHA
jgi:flavin reductase (DIM6/NTAB) family NADH-FMN oxidoreductase RutF